MLDTAIVGAGLCGLALANSLQAQGRGFALFEARPRPGGRIRTVEGVDLGPSWFWPETQPRMARLVTQLGLKAFPQHDEGRSLGQTDPNAKPAALEMATVHNGAMRMAGGTASLVQALVARLPATSFHFNRVLESLEDRGDHVALGFDDGRVVLARQAVLALPPRLLEEHVRFNPPLSPDMRQTMAGTLTWMATQAKMACVYPKAFWREQGLSGNAFASYPQAVLAEVSDAGDEASGTAALAAFVALPPALRQKFEAGLPMLAASQLAQLFGAQAGEDEQRYQLYQDWAAERYTCAELDKLPEDNPLAHPEYGEPALTQPLWDDKLYLGGTETAVYGGGYMEGALESAGRIVKQLLQRTVVAV